MSNFDQLIEQMIDRRVGDVLHLINTRGFAKDAALRYVFANSILGSRAKGEVCDRVNAKLKETKS